jgi:hypothetical protein
MDLVYPSSFAATAALTRADCTRLDQLSASEQAELDAGLAYVRAVNLRGASSRRKARPLPVAFAEKLSAYAEARMSRKTGIPAA